MQIDEIMKTVKDATDAVENAPKGQTKEEIKALVEETLKSVLANHPGLTPKRTLEFGDGLNTKDAILATMPKEVATECDKIAILSTLLNVKPQNLKSWGGFMRVAGDFKKAMDTAAATEGGNWVPTDLSNQLMEFVRLEAKVAALFPTINMPSNPYELPIQLGRFTSYKHSEQTANTGQTKMTKNVSSGTTGKITFTAVPHAVEVLASDELTEDSIIPMIPFLQKEIVTALAEGREDAILNGDDAGTHQDTNVTAAADRRKLWLGLRAMSLDQSYSRELATFTLSNLRLARADMGKYGIKPSDLAWVVSISAYLKLIDLDGVTTVDKYGPSATILTGELGKIDGIPIIVSEWQQQNLTSVGIYGASGTKTVMNLVYRPGFAMGTRATADIRVLRELYTESAQIALIARERIHWRDLYAIASNRTTNLARNIG